MVLIDQPSVLFAARALAHLMPFLDEVVMADVTEGGEVVGANGGKIVLDNLPVAPHVFSSSFSCPRQPLRSPGHHRRRHKPPPVPRSSPVPPPRPRPPPQTRLPPFSLPPGYQPPFPNRRRSRPRARPRRRQVAPRRPSPPWRATSQNSSRTTPLPL